MLIRLGVNPDEEILDSYCYHCQKINGHHLGCVAFVQETADVVRRNFAEEFEQIAYAEERARLYAEAWDDAYCPEAIHWRAVVIILSGGSLESE